MISDSFVTYYINSVQCINLIPPPNFSLIMPPGYVNDSIMSNLQRNSSQRRR